MTYGSYMDTGVDKLDFYVAIRISSTMLMFGLCTMCIPNWVFFTQHFNLCEAGLLMKSVCKCFMNYINVE